MTLEASLCRQNYGTGYMGYKKSVQGKAAGDRSYIIDIKKGKTYNLIGNSYGKKMLKCLIC